MHQQHTVLVTTMVDAIPSIQAFHTKHIPTLAAAMSPHISILYPFMPFEEVRQTQACRRGARACPFDRGES
jgi:hypothetical protein